MRTRCLAILIALAFVPLEAEAHRGVDRGAACDSLVELESELGSRLLLSSPGQEPGAVSMHFTGEALGEPATISYICVAGRVANQIISATFHERRPAEAFFERQLRALSAALGPPTKDLGAADTERIRQETGISADRLAIWDRSDRQVTLALTSGEHEPWKILLSGP